MMSIKGFFSDFVLSKAFIFFIVIACLVLRMIFVRDLLMSGMCIVSLFNLFLSFGMMSCIVVVFFVDVGVKFINSFFVRFKLFFFVFGVFIIDCVFVMLCIVVMFF